MTPDIHPAAGCAQTLPDQKQSPVKTLFRLLIALGCLGAPIAALYIFHQKMPVWFGGDQYATRGQFGDQFGAINALFSGLASGGLLLTLYFTLVQLRMLEQDRKDARKDRLRDERIDASTLLLRAITSELEIVSTETRIATVLFHEADARCIKNPGDQYAISEREKQRKTLDSNSLKLVDLQKAALAIRTEHSSK